MLNVYDKFTKPNELKSYNENYPYLAALQKLVSVHNAEGIPEDVEKLMSANKAKLLHYPLGAAYYAAYVMQSRWEEAEPTIMRDGEAIMKYVSQVINDGDDDSHIRWEDAEPYLKEYPLYAAEYALLILQRRWKEAEPFIKQDEEVWDDYIIMLGSDDDDDYDEDDY